MKQLDLSKQSKKETWERLQTYYPETAKFITELNATFGRLGTPAFYEGYEKLIGQKNEKN